MLAVHNRNGANSHLNKKGARAGAKVLAFVEIHTYNPAHRKLVVKPVQG